ncbi:hypothetical protein CRG98_017210 [Punica granatum]|uniref:Uncharacterized protein n=1 Tax=Punica granatum TaxID=22663 RepID=A0A2I0K1H7_PUNGR|nr:hypothetical protein CRG98_017210 [Punica granatum]
MEVESVKQQSSSPWPKPSPPPPPSPQRMIITVASIAAGIQFGWALQLSLLTPYVQLLGIPHTWAAFIWLCGPISGMVVQPVVGYHSDRCTSRFGRRRPFIAAGSALVATAVFLIGFSADLGHLFGDLNNRTPKPRAIAVFVVGFWILDVANNMLQGPCRALLADLAAASQRKTRIANSFYGFFMAVGNVLGFAAGSYTHLYRLFPFTRTKACDLYCANLKSCFFLSIALLLSLTALALSTVPEKPFSSDDISIDSKNTTAPAAAAAAVPTSSSLEIEEDAGDGVVTNSNNNNNNGYSSSSVVKQLEAPVPFFCREIFGVLRSLKRPMWTLLLVTGLNWIAWFPFLLFDTDWMGREVYGGKVGEGGAYAAGVRAGSLGLMLNSVVLGVMSLAVELLARGAGGVKRLWGCVNFLLALCLGLTVLITKLADSTRRFSAGEPLPPPGPVKAGALALFALLGIPLAVTYSIPFALASIFSNSSGAGQVLNLAIVIPQMLISVISGPWDALFGGGNLPAFVVGAVAAAVSGLLAITLLPSPVPDDVPPQPDI